MPFSQEVQKSNYTPRRRRCSIAEQTCAKDLPKVPTWRLEWYSNLRSSGPKVPNPPLSNHAPLIPIPPSHAPFLLSCILSFLYHSDNYKIVILRCYNTINYICTISRFDNSLSGRLSMRNWSGRRYLQAVPLTEL